MRVALVIPVWNEARALLQVARWVAALDPRPEEVVVVDGGSADDSRALAAAIPGARVLASPRGRGAQLNVGAAACSSEVLWFVHADCEPPPDAIARIRQALAAPEVVGGAFVTWAVRDRPTWLGPLVHIVDVRSRLTRYPYGDQAMFVRREAFEQLAGFRPFPLMEDLDLAVRLTVRGRLVTLRPAVRVSARRAIARPFKYTLVYNSYPWLFRAGVSPERLAAWYDAIR